MSPLPKVFCRPEQLQQPPKTLRPEEETGCFICCHGYTDTKPVCHCVVCSSNSIGTSTPTCFCHWQLKIIRNWASSITRNFEHCEYIHSPRIQSHFRMADSSPKCHWKKSILPTRATATARVNFSPWRRNRLLLLTPLLCWHQNWLPQQCLQQCNFYQELSFVERNFELCKYKNSPNIKNQFRMADFNPKCHRKKSFFRPEQLQQPA